MKCETFAFFRELEFSKREEGLRELRENGIRYIVLAGSRTLATSPYTVSAVAENENLAREVREFIELAYEDFDIYSLIFAGRRISNELFLNPNFVRAQSDMIARGMRKLKDVKGLYAIYIEDEPYNTWNLCPEIVRDRYNDLFEEETGYRLPEEGRVEGRWNFETAMAYCHWIGEKYLEYLREIVRKCKEVCPHVKSAINLHAKAIFPSARNPVNVYGIIKLIDILMTDIYPGWHLMPREMDNIVDFQTKFLRDLTDKPLWVILQGHLIIGGYAPTLQQIEKWALVAIENGCDAVGWYANDHNCAPHLRVCIRTQHTKYACRERWNKMMEVSRRISELEKRKIEKTNAAILVSFNSILSYGWLSLLYTYITLQVDGGVRINFITERKIEEEPETLNEYQYLYLGSSPVLRESVMPILEDFVRKGGVIMGSGSDVSYNEKGEDLSMWRKRLFGIIEEKTFWSDEPIRLTTKIGCLEQGFSLKCFWERRAIIKTQGSVDVLGVWTNGYPAIISKAIGKGKAIYIGTRPEMANCLLGERRWADLLREIKHHFSA